MAASRSPRILLNGALFAMVLACPVFACPTSDSGNRIHADALQTEKSKSERERCKREGARTPAKGCADGGERLPQDKRSPLDRIPPLSPLVA